MFGPALLLCLLPAEPAVTVARAAGPPLTGRVVVVGADGGVLLETPDGVLHAVSADDGRGGTSAGPFVPLPPTRLGGTLLAELDRGATLTVTPHYAIASAASREATGRVADLLEAVQAEFRATFGGDGPLPRPRRTLPVLILKDRAAFEAHVGRPDAPYGEVPAGSRGFYDPVTNRVVLFEPAERTPGAPDLGTVAHEAVHQLAYNCGLHARLADNPMWVTEGIAMLAEPTSPRRPHGWAGFDRRNVIRAREFRQFLIARDRDSALRGTNPLEQLVGTDALFFETRTGPAAYAAAWALTDALARREPAALRAYLADLAAKPPLVQETIADRLALFRRHFGGDLDAIWRAVSTNR